MEMDPPDHGTADVTAAHAQSLDPTRPWEFVGHIDNDDAYLSGPRPGGVLSMVPGIWSGMPDELLVAMRARRKASSTGRCPNCDACVELGTGVFWHEDWCRLTDKHLGPVVAAWVRRVGPARGRRLVEDPRGPSMTDVA